MAQDDSDRQRGVVAERRSRFRRVIEQVTLLELGALAIGIVSIVLFGLLARAVMHDEVMRFNRDTLLAIHTYATPTLDSVAMALTQLGSVPAVIVIGAIVGWLLRRAGRRIDVWALVAVLGGGGILSITLKSVFGLDRPDVFQPLYHPMGQSFPSGHSLISYCLYGYIAVWLVASNLRNPLRWLGAIACIVLATTIALTRLYIGVHWPSDILAGLLVATFWLTACFIGRQIARTRVGRRVDLETT
jgi:membrane-associated phospholipid phosphatase